MCVYIGNEIWKLINKSKELVKIASMTVRSDIT